MQDLASWHREELRAFIRALSSRFPGTVVWMTLSKLAQQEGHVGKDYRHLYEDARYQMLDAEIVPLILAETNWIVYDGYHVTEPLAYAPNHGDYFADNIHHPGRLTHLGWQFILGHYCPLAAPMEAAGS